MDKGNTIGIIGCGHMGEAIARGVLNSNLVTSRDLYLYDIDKEKTNYLSQDIRANITTSTEELVNFCNTVILAVKPQDTEDLLGKIWHVLDASKFVISITAGITIEKITKSLREEVRMARVMPNMAALQNQSISAICYNTFATREDKELVKKIFKSIGDVLEVDESQMDAVTAVSGSGPAYFFYLVEILEKCAVDMGMDKANAKLLAVKTAFGSAVLLRDSSLDAGALRRRVTSKGGTTEAAFRVFEEGKLGELLEKGIKAAKERAAELSRGK